MTRHQGFPSRLLVLAAIALTANNARANGAFPDEFSVHFSPKAVHRLYMGANFGLIVSEDEGLTWRYSCEPWIVSSSNAALAYASVSFYQVTADDALLADSVTVTRSSDVACTWPVSTGSVAGSTVADFFPDPNDASFVLAIVVTTTASYIVGSHDGGQTFDAPHLYDTTDLLTGVEIARSKPGVIYATSRSTSTPRGPARLLLSTTSGAQWTAMTLPIPSDTEPRILAIDPADEKKIYLRLSGGVSDAMMMTVDGGQTFQMAIPAIAQFSSFLRAGDGAVYAGTRTGKLYVQPAGVTGFTVRDAPHLRCLGQRPGTSRIYACADMFLDGYSLGYSDDSGVTFHGMMSFTQILGPLTCPTVQANCAAHWGRIQQVLGIKLPDAGQGTNGGAPGPSGGSHCATGGVDAWSVGLVVAFMVRRRRR